VPFSSVLADTPKSKKAKVTLVYQNELPNIKGVLVEYAPAATRPATRMPKSAFIYATVLGGRSAVRSTTAW
jgi:quercetin dioxygenase-like cupin family protein